MFDPRSARIFKIVNIEKSFPLWLVYLLEILSLILFLVFLSLFLFSSFQKSFSPDFNGFLFQRTCLSLFVFGIFFLYSLFFNLKLKKPGIEDPDNLANLLDFKAAKIVENSIHSDFSFNLSLLLNLLSQKELLFCFRRLLLPVKEIKREIKRFQRPREDEKREMETTISLAKKIAFSNQFPRISIFQLFAALTHTEPFLKEILNSFELTREEVEEVTSWEARIKKERELKKKFWERENLARRGGFSKGWSYGYTITLDQFSWEVSELIKVTPPSDIILHQKEIKDLEDALIKEGSRSALVVGEPGVGRRTVVLNFADKILKGKSYKTLNWKRVIELDMPALIAGSRDIRGLEMNLKLIFDEVLRAGNIILVIHQIHNYIGFKFGAEAVAKVDISGILSQYLPYPQFKLLGITTYEGFHRSIGNVPELVAQFTKIEVKPSTPTETFKVLEEEVLEKEKKTGLFITFKSVKSIIDLANRYIGDVPFPKKAIDLLNEIIIYELRYGRKSPGIILPEEVAALVSQKVEIPVGKTEEEERNLLLNLEEIIHKRLINQEEAVSEVSNALRRARADILREEKTIGSFLFLGPTGVGKTETSKCLAEAYFGSKKRMIRLDMSEYQGADSIKRLIGGEEEPGYFTTQVREDPFSLILLDEIEKAHPNILNLFLQVLDEGRLTDAFGRSVNFKNTIIISTSNAGSELIRQAIKEGKDLVHFREEFIDKILRRGIFRPEFLNRFDAIVLFRPLAPEHLYKIAEIMLDDLKEGLREKNIELLISPELIDKVSKLGFDPEFGAREMRRVIQDKVENSIAKAILGMKIRYGSKIKIDPETFEVLTI